VKVLIIGNGITGITCARHIRKNSDCEITVISSETDHFYSRTALMYIYMGHMRYKDTKPYEDRFWIKNNINLKRAYVASVDFEGKKIFTDLGETLTYDKLVIATGSKSNKFGWPGQDLPGVQGLYNIQDLELLEKNSANINRAVIVGGGLIGIELAEMLHSRHIPVTLLVRESSFWNNVLPAQDSELINRHIRKHGFDLRLNSNLGEITQGANGRANGVIIKETGERIDCELVGLTAGVSPNVDFLKGGSLKLDRGVVINEYFETNQSDVYAGGDCAQFESPLPGRRPIEQVWYTGKMHGRVIAERICGLDSAYEPGPWFNSAKFLDVEYQTYGMVMPKLRENETELYWEDESGERAIHFVYDKTSLEFLGLNVFGIRLRHNVFDNFLRNGRKMDYVLQNLKAANFDPEFYQTFEPEIIQAYNSKTGSKLKVKRAGGLKAVLNLLGR